MTKLKIPYGGAEVDHCFDRLKETLPVYQKGIADIRSAMESNNLFEERLRKVLRLHAALLQAAQNEESPQSWNEEDVYLCVLYDMFEAMYASEADRIAAGSGLPQQKASNLYSLSGTIARLPFGSPQYVSTIRPRLQKIVSDRSKKFA
jgi:hypothetical protein